MNENCIAQKGHHMIKAHASFTYQTPVQYACTTLLPPETRYRHRMSTYVMNVSKLIDEYTNSSYFLDQYVLYKLYEHP